MNRDNRRGQRKRRGQGNKTIYVLVDGETEKLYLDQLKNIERLKSITIKPDLNKKKTIAQQFETIKEESKHYDQAIWMVDFDTILKEEREFKGGRKSPLIVFNECYRELSEIENVNVLVNVPCLEYWYLLHIKNSGRFYSIYSELERELNAIPILGYNKSRKYYISGGGIYARLKPNLNTAYQRAKALGQYDSENPQQAKAEIYRLFEILEIEL
ncbi:RloB family protein [Ancylomarina sp. 16SWW S1-10-2]|uniref:RloB family protein n=1 Tax=Ancylomarina sp. 16SWW S1-10-2 TaxID=2499681 RepID=UPI0012AE12B4|nr:RloB family protein [Ancylomarina sp. 16SWW S1-10-2]MRT93663.1 RloB domain-containing protein [Ancylomarina sp. 16SWW S1-10-2]